MKTVVIDGVKYEVKKENKSTYSLWINGKVYSFIGKDQLREYQK